MRARRASAFAAAVALVAVAGVSRGTFAAFAGSTTNPGNTFALTSLYPPSTLTATPAGANVEAVWDAGRNGNGYRLLSAPAPNPLVNDCTGAVYVPVVAQAGTTYTHALAAPAGTWRCYTVVTTYHSWTSVSGNPVAGARLGFVASVVDFANGGNGSRIDAGDTFTITFNQPVDPATGPQAGNTICWVNDRIVLGSTQSGNCSATDLTPRLGSLTGGAVDRNFRFAATWDWSNGNRTLTATVGARLSGTGNYSNSGAWTFTPAASVQSATGSLGLCNSNAGGANCLPAVAGL